MSSQEVIYQVNLDVDARIAGEFDAWLQGHVEDMLAIAGFVSAEILTDEESGAGARAGRTVQYRVASRADLDHYFTHEAERMRAEGVARFGDAFTADRRILSPDHEKASGIQSEPVKTCQNCKEPLTGQYCHHCGQRDRSRMISLWELFRDLIGDMFELDSRLWRSLVPLLIRPGKLTYEYLAGRRVHYTPPLRMYLVLSILFFVIASFGSGDTRVTIDGTDISSEQAESEEDRAEKAAVCDELEIDLGLDYLNRPEIMALIKAKCHSIVADKGKKFARDLYNNLPKMMFIFLPLIALVQKVLYIGSRRYYVEHLLFFVHFHSFFFLLLTLTILLTRMPAVVPGQGVITGLAIAAVSIYIPVYLFKALRRVYGQGFFFTLFKYCLLFVAYIFCLTVTMMVGLVYTALSV